MSEPKTTLDTRFSDPDTSPTSWHDTVRALEITDIHFDRPIRGNQ